MNREELVNKLNKLPNVECVMYDSYDNTLHRIKEVPVFEVEEWEDTDIEEDEDSPIKPGDKIIMFEH